MCKGGWGSSTHMTGSHKHRECHFMRSITLIGHKQLTHTLTLQISPHQVHIRRLSYVMANKQIKCDNKTSKQRKLYTSFNTNRAPSWHRHYWDLPGRLDSPETPKDSGWVDEWEATELSGKIGGANIVSAEEETGGWDKGLTVAAPKETWPEIPLPEFEDEIELDRDELFDSRAAGDINVL